MSSVSPIHQTTPPKVVPLLNSVIDVCLVYGIDETSARELPVTSEDGDIHAVYDSLLERDIKLHFLQILTPCAVYPDRTSKTPQSNIWSPGGSPDLQNGLPPEKDVESSIQTSHSKKFKMDKTGLPWETIETVHWFMYPEGPQLSGEDVEPTIIPMLFTNMEGTRSYATGLRFYRPFFVQKLESSHFYNIISWEETQVPPPNSKLVYLPTCVVLVSKNPYFQFQKDALSGFHRRLCDEEESSLGFWQCVQRFTERLFLVPAPPPGLLAVECLLPGFSSSLIIRPPRRECYPDIRLNYPFLCLSLENVLKVMAALLTEQRIIFVSSLYPMLTYVIQCFLHYIYPFDWRLPCVPILPFLQIDYLDAVGSNIMGCHANMTKSPEFMNLEEVVIVDLDSDCVTCKLRESTSLPPLPSYPTEVFCSRYEQLSKVKFEVEQLKQLTHMSSDNLLKEKAEFEHTLDSCLSTMFLEFMVNIYYDVTERLVESRVKFDEAVKELQPEDQIFYRHTNLTEMFSAFYQSRRQRTRDDFTLLAERMKRSQRKSVNDGAEDISTLFMASTAAHTPTTPQGGHTSLRQLMSGGSITGLGPLISSFLPGRRSTQTPTKPCSSPSCIGVEDTLRISPPMPPSSLTSLSILSSSPSSSSSSSCDMVHLELPSLRGNTFSRESFITEASKALSILTDNKSVRAQCMYLIAFYHICQGRLVEAMDDLYDNLPKLEIQLRPSPSLTQKILALLSEEQLREVSERSYYKYIIPVTKKAAALKRHQTMGSRASYNLDRKLPTKPLGIDEFRKMVRENAIVTDAESADNLFKILSQNRASISPHNFIPFYDAWKLVQQETMNVDLLGFELEKGDKGKTAELVIAVGEQARTPYGGQNHLVLTTYRFLAVTNFKTHVLADLRHSLQVVKSDLPLGLLPGSKMTAGITITPVSGEGKEERKAAERVTSRITRNLHNRLPSNDPYAGFEDVEERDHWYRMLLEVQSGWKVSQARKDPGVMETAMCHVVLLDAIVGSGLLDKLNHTQKTKFMMKLMTLQSKDVSEVSQFTVEALQYRINPCLHETERQTVESLLYIPPLDPLEPGLGKLWIGLGNGCLKVYDMDEKCFESNINISDSKLKSLRLSCLLLVNQTVWVASFFSKNIHILDAETVCHVSQLSYLEEAPRDLSLSTATCYCSGQDLVWCLLVNGTLLAFDPDTRSRMCKMQVPVYDDGAYFTCTCFTVWRHTLWVGTNRGTIAVMDAEDGKCIHEIFFPGGRRKQVEIKHLALSGENEIWCSVNSTPRSKDSTFLTVFDPASYEKRLHYTNLESRVAVILPVDNSMWCGTKGGKILIFNAQNYSTGETSQLSAHEDIIRTMAVADRYVVSGSGSNDGYAAVWRAVSS